MGDITDDVSLLGIPVPVDVLQPLLTAASSSSLKETLEILVESSRTGVGRSDLASKNILPTVLRLIQSICYASCRQYLLLSLKLLRNLCAGDITNQNLFIECNGVGVVLTILRFTGLDSGADCGIVRMALQVLANVSLAGERHQRAIWSLFFPNEFVTLAKELCEEKGFAIMTEILVTASSVGFKEDWLKLLVSRICVEEIHFPLFFSNLYQVSAPVQLEDPNLIDNTFSTEQAFLLRIVSEIVNERIEEIIIPIDFALSVLEIFKRSIRAVDFSSKGKFSLPTPSSAINVLGYSLTILRDICSLEGSAGSSSEGSIDVVDTLKSSGLIELLLCLLCDLEPPAIIRKAMRLSENQDGTNSHSYKTCPYMGFRRDIVAVIGNCAYRRKHIQDEIRERNGVLLLLQQCVTDEDNPFLREWGIWSVRNLLEGNAENQQAVIDLELQGSVEVPELAGLGLKVEVDQKTRRAKLVNISSKKFKE
ncbi:ataxin-10-like isoform X2 [Pistacia vera]|uniref:ataxin-10-like isoform X2 n=1 Tax=Pistacia vera TaxID=55513 RepID=UPI0012630755|nr:ataxin-10-like isoform X2 [Pistacia vera]